MRDIFGELGEEKSDEVVQKILNFIHSHPMKEVLKLKGIEEKSLKKLKQIE